MTTELRTTIPARSDNSGPGAGDDLYDQLLVAAQLEANADAAERLDRAYASLERRLERLSAQPHELVLARLEATASAAERKIERITAALAAVDAPAPAVSRDQLRLVVGG